MRSALHCRELMKPDSLQFISQDTRSDRSPSGSSIGVPKTPPGAPDTGGRAQRLSAGSSLNLPGGCGPRGGSGGARKGAQLRTSAVIARS